MKALLEPIKEIARFDELFRDLKKGTAGVTVISGCLESQKAHMIAGLSEDAPVRLLIAENELKAFQEFFRKEHLFLRHAFIPYRQKAVPSKILR